MDQRASLGCASTLHHYFLIVALSKCPGQVCMILTICAIAQNRAFLLAPGRFRPLRPANRLTISHLLCRSVCLLARHVLGLARDSSLEIVSMSDHLSNVFSWLEASGWAIPFMGVLAFGLALLIGRLLLSHSDPRHKPVELDTTFLQGIIQDRRAAPRRQGGTTVELEVSLGNEQPTVRAWVLNRSIGGLGLLMDTPLELGQVIKVRARNSQGIKNWVELTVRNCRRSGIQYEIGGQFHHIPDWNQMLQFG